MTGGKAAAAGAGLAGAAAPPGNARAPREPRPKPPPADFGPVQVLRHTGLAEWQWDAAAAAGLTPPPDAGGRRWSAAAAAAVTAGRDQIIAAVGTEPPVGGHRAAARLAGRTGLAVEKTDVEALADAGLLAVAGWYKQWPLWDCRALDAVDAGALGAVVAERQAWIAGSISKWDAPAYLGWRREEFTRIARQRGLQTGRLDRYARAGLDTLAGDEDLAEQVRLDRLLMTCQAAEHLEIRETDLRYLLAGDLIVPKTHTAVQVSRYRWVDVPLYRTGDLEALREHPDIDWEAVRAVRPGEPSPLRHLARRPADRAAVIRRGIAELGDRYGAEVWAWWNNNAGIWEADFERPRRRSHRQRVQGRHRRAPAAARAPRGHRGGHRGRRRDPLGPGDARAGRRGHPGHRDHRPGRIHRGDRRPRRGHRRGAAGHAGQPGLPGRAGRPLGARHHRRAAGRRAAAGRGAAPAA